MPRKHHKPEEIVAKLRQRPQCLKHEILKVMIAPKGIDWVKNLNSR